VALIETDVETLALLRGDLGPRFVVLDRSQALGHLPERRPPVLFVEVFQHATTTLVPKDVEYDSFRDCLVGRPAFGVRRLPL